MIVHLLIMYALMLVALFGFTMCEYSRFCNTGKWALYWLCWGNFLFVFILIIIALSKKGV